MNNNDVSDVILSNRETKIKLEAIEQLYEELKVCVCACALYLSSLLIVLV